MLERACSAADLKVLGEDVRKVKRHASTRPHPMAPTSPPLNKLFGPGLGLVDRMRDAVTGRGKDETPAKAKAGSGQATTGPRGAGRAGSAGRGAVQGAGTRTRQAKGETYDELYAEAKRRHIEGRSKMNKQELAKALKR